MEQTKTKTNAKSRTLEIVLVGLAAALMCIAGPFSIPIPFSPVPISLTNLAIYIAAFILEWKLCGLSTVIYLLLGMVGLPVFSGFTGGLSKLAGPTGGYLIGFIFTALICGFFCHKFNKIYMYVIGMVLGLAVAYIFGTAWFMIQQDTGLIPSLTMCVIPFLPGDAVKIVIAAILGPILKKQVSRIKA
ncbi:biotin transporter BioY [Porcipelethomonas sp.]|uniref:biotin transporter BioY n=1 Tax=Porcipelethomonas sp. TaxID=2981675 RepID=UPI003EF40D75